MPLLDKLLLLAGAGALGTLTRFGIARGIQLWLGSLFPWGTFIVNVSGCFLFGLVYILGEERQILSAEARLILLTGFMGAYTTFSTYIFESAGMLRDAQWLPLAGYLIGQLILGLAGLYLGMAAARVL